MTIEGIATDADGNRIRNAKVAVFLSDQSAGATGTVKWTETDSNGNFVIERHPDGTGNTQSWHVAGEYTDGSSNEFNAFSKPYVSASVNPVIPDSGISQEEDGDLAEYSGDTSYYGATSSPTISGSDYAISYSNDQSPTYVEAPFEGGEYGEFSMYVYPEDVNNEVLLVDSDSGNVVFGVYHRSEDHGIFYSGANAELGSVTDGGSTSREGGTELVPPDVPSEYYHVELTNIDWSAGTLDIAVDGSTVASDEAFIGSGVPDTIQLTSNSGINNPNSGGYVDKVDSE